ncbi:UNVERIFIED_CONTAM: hypothetical protein FKN15_062990 [Acipenser sinensis]
MYGSEEPAEGAVVRGLATTYGIQNLRAYYVRVHSSVAGALAGTREQMPASYQPLEDKGQPYRCPPELTRSASLNHGSASGDATLPSESPVKTDDFAQPGRKPVLPGL